MNWIIRKAQGEDWKAIQSINRQIFEFELNIEPSSNLAFPDRPEAIDYFQKAAEGRDDHIAFVCDKKAR